MFYIPPVFRTCLSRHSIKLCLVASIAILISLPHTAQATDIRDPASEAGLVPHKALYAIELAGVQSGSQIANISGKMFYEWQPSCDAWVSKHRFNVVYEYADSPALQVTSDFSTYEPFDAGSMNFSSQRKRGGVLFEELRGQAVAEEGREGEVTYTKPDGLSFDLPEGTVFPMAHSLELLSKLKAGKKFYTSTIFDGSDQDGPVEVNAFIGKPANAMANLLSPSGVDTALVNTPAHSVRLAFFPLKDDGAAADYEMSIIFHENGVISDMVIEYDNFSVTQKLVALEALGQGCEDG